MISNVTAGQQKALRLFIDARLVIRDPANFWGNVDGVQIQPGEGKRPVVTQRAARGVALRSRTAIHPNDGRAQRPPCRIHRHNAIHLSGGPQRADVFGVDARGGQQLANGRGQRIGPPLHRLFGPQGLGVIDGIALRSFADQRAVERKQNRFGAL